jgi:hypothetical protein
MYGADEKEIRNIQYAVKITKRAICETKMKVRDITIRSSEMLHNVDW